MEIDERDRIGPARSSGGSLFGLTYFVFGAIFLALTVVVFFGVTPETIKGTLETAGLIKREDFSAQYRRLAVPPLPPETEADATITGSLEKLGREPCDSHAIFSLADTMAKRHEERWAAEALIGWSAACAPDNAGELRQASSLFINLHDYTRADAIVSGLVAAHPATSDYWYLKGKAEAGLHQIDDALLSYANTIHFSTNPATLGRWVFNEMSDLYVASNRTCEAIGPLQDYISFAPAARMTAQEQGIIQAYAEKGHCAAFAAGAETFPVNDANIIHARVSINGVAGTFVVDTGASFVVVTKAFATRAHLDTAEAASLRATTANGAVYDRLTSAGLVKVGRVEAKQVPVAVQDGPLGDLDGLLGRSFLSRFNLTIASDHWALRPKAVTATAP